MYNRKYDSMSSGENIARERNANEGKGMLLAQVCKDTTVFQYANLEHDFFYVTSYYTRNYYCVFCETYYIKSALK